MRFSEVLTLAASSMLLAAHTAVGQLDLPPIRAEAVGMLPLPTYLTHAPDGSDRLFVLQRTGLVRIIEDGRLVPEPFLDISDQVHAFLEGGLVGMAFHPDYVENGYFYLHYTPFDPEDFLDTVIGRFQVCADDPYVADPASEQVVLRLDQPDGRHQGAWLDFGPLDGYLYLAFGDGGFDGLGRVRAQDPGSLFGKILRIDVDGDDFPRDPERNYAIPPDNPYASGGGAGEVWALGLRNPYRASFDPANGNLWVGDVGEESQEEVNVIRTDEIPPLNFGWGCMEGSLCNGTECLCGDPGLTLPVLVYSHQVGTAVTGGTVYRGCGIPGLGGTYFVGDYGNGRIWAIEQDNGTVLDFEEVTEALQPIEGQMISHIVNFGQDRFGELYIVSIDGLISKIVPEDPIVPDPCNTCSADFDATGPDGVVDVQDLLLILAGWGDADSDLDIDGSGVVDVGDLLALLAAWGPCPG